jgi:sugar lactone lactonase YvrE
MKTGRLFPGVLFLAGACSSGGPGPGREDGGPDGSMGMDASIWDGGNQAGGDGGNCGTVEPDLTGIEHVETVVVARDGTLYYSKPRAVGRLLPTGENNATWVTISEAETVFGLALDGANTTLYATSPTAKRVYEIQLDTDPIAEVLVDNAGIANGLTLGPDGALWYTDFTGGDVYRVDVSTGVRTQVTTSRLLGPNVSVRRSARQCGFEDG